jgi:hypothetical protein
MSQQREDFLMCQDEWLMKLNNTPAFWAAWRCCQDDYRQSLRIKPLFVVSTSRNGKARYCGGAEFTAYEAAIAFVENNPTKLGFQGISCRIP